MYKTIQQQEQENRDRLYKEEQARDEKFREELEQTPTGRYILEIVDRHSGRSAQYL